MDPFILDVITYYLRMGTQPIYFQIYTVKVRMAPLGARGGPRTPLQEHSGSGVGCGLAGHKSQTRPGTADCSPCLPSPRTNRAVINFTDTQCEQEHVFFRSKDALGLDPGEGWGIGLLRKLPPGIALSQNS